MGVLKFRLTPPELSDRLPELRRAYMTGLDRTPERMSVEVKRGLLICNRESPESGRLHVPWPVEGFGIPFVGTATLAERSEPYDLAVELARGKLNDVRGQAADWVQLGLKMPAEVEAELASARRGFARAATSRDTPERAVASAQESLAASFRAGRKLTEAYTAQVLRKRLEHAPKLPTLLSCGLNFDPTKAPALADALGPAFNAGRIRCAWADLAPDEGQYRWASFEAQLDLCKKHGWMPMAGPLIDLRPAALPDWLWLWSGDWESITNMALDLVRQAVTRYRGLIGTWHLVARPGAGEVLGLSEEEQVRLTARAVQAARQIDPATPIVVDFDRPWAEWLRSNRFQLGPLHISDSLARAEIGLSGVGLELAPGYSNPGSHLRDLFEFSRLLDLYALLNLPLFITLVFPAGVSPDPKADPEIQVEAGQWPSPPDEALQTAMATSWLSLAAAKPFVRAVSWKHASDADPHQYPQGGLFKLNQSPRPVLDWIRSFRQSYLH